MLVGLTALSEEIFLHAAGRGGTGCLICAQHIVLDGLVGAALHQGHMLVGRGVEHHIGAVLFHDPPDPAPVPDRADEGRKVQIR